MPLIMANTGEKLFIKKVNGKEKTRKFLEDIGFVEGTQITVVSRLKEDLIINVKGSKIALSREIASKIIVWGGNSNVHIETGKDRHHGHGCKATRRRCREKTPYGHGNNKRNRDTCS